MTQAYLTVAGLALDFVGFCLLLREWWLGFYSEAEEMRVADELARGRKLRDFAAQHAAEAQRRHMETAGRMQDDMTLGRARAAQLAVRRGRRGVFILASVLIVAGFALQIAGAWPG